MAANAKKENAKTRYDAKNPTVSFRVSKDELERLDELRRDGATFREMVLRGAGMMERDRASEKRRTEQAVEEARMGALSRVPIGICSNCGRPLCWDLKNRKHLEQLTDAVGTTGLCHSNCRGR